MMTIGSDQISYTQNSSVNGKTLCILFRTIYCLLGKSKYKHKTTANIKCFSLSQNIFSFHFVYSILVRWGIGLASLSVYMWTWVSMSLFFSALHIMSREIHNDAVFTKLQSSAESVTSHSIHT